MVTEFYGQSAMYAFHRTLAGASVYMYYRPFGFRVQKKGKLGSYAIKRVAAGAHIPTPWLFEPAKRPDDAADYCLDYSSLPRWKHQILVFTLEWSKARPNT